jgi:hypothetical protein
MKNKVKGVTTVEFALVGGLFFLVLFGILEFGRLLFVWNTLTEATRRGARIAAVCPVNHSAIARIAVLDGPTSGGSSPILPGLSTANVDLRYLDVDGIPIGDPVGNFTTIRYVRVRIIGYSHNMIIPMFTPLLNAPPFQTTLPRESLGVPRVGAGPQCFGTAA